MQFIIDAQTGEVGVNEPTGGVMGFISWRRLREMFRDSGETKKGEELLSYKLDEHGIHFRVRSR